MHIDISEKTKFPVIPKKVYHLYIYGNPTDKEIGSIPETVRYIRIRYTSGKITPYLNFKPKLLGLKLELENLINDPVFPFKTFPLLKHLKNLRQLSFSNVFDYSTPIKISSLPEKLEFLSIYNANIPRVSEKDFPKSLRKLSLYLTNTSKISDLTTLVNLEYIKVSECGLEKIPRLPPHKLKFLYLSTNNIKNIPEHIKDLKNLVELDLLENKISGVLDLDILSNIKVLELSQNYIKSIKQPCLNSNLISIGLAKNLISKIPDLTLLKNLKTLSAWGTPLDTFPLCLPKSLKHLNLHSAKIIHIPDVSYLKNLESLYIFNNDIKTFDKKNFDNLRLKNKKLMIKVIR